MRKSAPLLLFLTVLLTGCGGGTNTTEKLFTLNVGAKWVYQVSGSVAITGLTNNSIPLDSTKSTLTITVDPATVKDANAQDVNILDRKLDLFTRDGQEIKSNLRLYVKQASNGIFVHGFNSYMGDTIDLTKNIFVPATAAPKFAFLYIPDPVSLAVPLSYAKPFDTAATGVYQVAISDVRSVVQVPAGSFLAKPFLMTEGFDQVNITNGALVPEIGMISATISATLADKTILNGALVLKSYTF